MASRSAQRYSRARPKLRADPSRTAPAAPECRRAILAPVAKKRAKPRARTVLRERARASEKLYEARQKLAALEPGGSPERPLAVSSASVVESRAEAAPCLRCEGPVRCDEHTTLATERGLLRVVHVRCPACGAKRTMYLQIASTLH